MIKYVITIGTAGQSYQKTLVVVATKSQSLGTPIPKALFLCAHIQLGFNDSVF